MDEKDKNSILIGDIDINYYRKGHGKKAVILLHGNNEDATIFEPYFETVSDSIKTYALDTRGNGCTKCGEKEYTIKRQAIDTMRFINQKPFEKATIVGYSDGANIAMYLGKIAPELIDKMVLISGNIFVKGLKDAFYKNIRCRYKLLQPFSKVSRSIKLYTQKLELMLNNIGVYPEDLEKFNFPTLIIDAENDLIEKEHTELIARSIKNSKRMTIPGTNHIDIIKNQNTFDAINKFIY